MSVVQAKKDSSDEHWRDQIARVMQEYEEEQNTAPDRKQECSDFIICFVQAFHGAQKCNASLSIELIHYIATFIDPANAFDLLKRENTRSYIRLRRKMLGFSFSTASRPKLRTKAPFTLDSISPQQAQNTASSTSPPHPLSSSSSSSALLAPLLKTAQSKSKKNNMSAGGKSSSSSSLSSTRAPSKQQDVLDSFSAMHQSSSASFTPASLANTTRNQARETTPGGRRPMYVNTDVRKTNSRLQNLSLSSSSTRTRRVMGHSASASLLSCAPSSQRRAQRTGSTHPSHSGGSSSCQTTFTGLETRSSVSSAAAASLLARRQQKQSFDSFAKNRNAKLPVQTSHRVRLDLRTRSNPTSSAPSPSSLTSSSTPSRSALSSHHFDSSLSSTSTNDSPSSFTSKSMPPPSPIDRKSKGVHTHKHRRKKSYNTNNYSYSHNHSHNHNTSRNHIPATTQMNGHLSRIVPLVHPSTPYLFPVDTTMQMPQALPARPSSSRGRPQTHAGVSGGRSGPYLCNSGSLTSRVYSSSNGGSKTETNTIGNSDKESNSKVTNILSLEE